MRRQIRVRSTQKLPNLSVRLRAKPRTRAIATAMPTAADTKFCTANPAICTRWPMVDSPEYDCQLVLVTKLTAVFQATLGSTLGMSLASGSQVCSRWKKYNASTDTRLNDSSEMV